MMLYQFDSPEGPCIKNFVLPSTTVFIPAIVFVRADYLRSIEICCSIYKYVVVYAEICAAPRDSFSGAGLHTAALLINTATMT